MLEILKLTVTGLLILLPLANPLTTVALFLGLSGNMTENERNKQARMAAIYIFSIMIIAWYAGQVILTTFGISIPGLRIAGGLIVSFIGFNMLFPKDEASKPADNNETVVTSKNIAFVPLAMPGTAGPGTIALIISTASTVDQINDLSMWAFWITPILVFLIASFMIWICLKSANTISRFFGKSGIDAISSIMGFLLICMGVQFAINGILEIVQSLS